MHHVCTTYTNRMELNVLTSASGTPIFIPAGRSIRDSNENTYRNRQVAPRFWFFLINKLCSFRGQEKGPGDAGDPKQELRDKLKRAYDPAPYVSSIWVLCHRNKVHAGSGQSTVDSECLSDLVRPDC